jgi:Tol biopolymer transport system component
MISPEELAILAKITLQRLTNNNASDEDPSWSPDGSRISCRSNRDGKTEIYG